ncbi:hypothetical protein CISG_02920 [Coccidioides immitis RMSCC 3703]|uniref:BZIP domain-containing protein n=2 Tax=Coccidioides immitis TaxID=5501 RepID=A0A0J8QII9_COCIT|nr:hypothetical protein CIRG_08154 [Coccidioides immitis RMSCC 2394]KMU72271.1 hypothetical protein CISG_02920 [Coccidioides immitis RMSCC 3703]
MASPLPIVNPSLSLAQLCCQQSYYLATAGKDIFRSQDAYHTAMQRRGDYPASPQSNSFSRTTGSSAFSENALPDEDWTQVSDLTERRRIQNRIAQRNYRKKLKQRMENLEKEERCAAQRDTTSPSGGISHEDRSSRLQSPACQTPYGFNQTSPTDLAPRETMITNSHHTEAQSYPYQQHYALSELASSTLPYTESYAYVQYPVQSSYYSATSPYGSGFSSDSYVQAPTPSHRTGSGGDRAFVAHAESFLEYNTSFTGTGVLENTALYQQSALEVCIFLVQFQCSLTKQFLQPSLAEPRDYHLYDPNGFPVSDAMTPYSQRKYRPH